jgi:hypothetical protein
MASPNRPKAAFAVAALAADFASSLKHRTGTPSRMVAVGY